MGGFIMAFAIVTFSFIVLSTTGVIPGHEYNTETVCYNDQGDVILYEWKYKPGKGPVELIVEKEDGNNIYRKRDGGRLAGTCSSSWGAHPPKGKQHYLK